MLVKVTSHYINEHGGNMNRKAFIKLINDWQKLNSLNSKTHTLHYAEQILSEIERIEAQGDFIFENDTAVIGKFYHSISILPEASIDGKLKNIQFCIYGIGIKCNADDGDYDLKEYTEFEYIIL